MQLAASFRDPSGYVFVEDGIIRRRILPSYFAQFRQLHSSGLYDALTADNRLIPHRVLHEAEDAIVIQPDQLAFVSYPYEWSFQTLKDAALLTLSVMRTALDHGMVLKDATAYNVQLHGGRLVFIDTLSFEVYRDGMPWHAYGQFCRHFLAPLLLMKHVGLESSRLLSAFIDGVPLDLASAMLPLKTHFSLFVKTNIHWHAKTIGRTEDSRGDKQTVQLPRQRLLSLLDYLRLGIERLQADGSDTEWGDYYNKTNYSASALSEKEVLVSSWIAELGAKRVWDAGGNDGHFLRTLKGDMELLLCTDIDPVAVDKNYRHLRRHGPAAMVPLKIDLTSPSSAIGFANAERESLSQRIVGADVQCALALAVIHHLCITNNCSFDMVLSYFRELVPALIIEFVPPGDSWAETLLDNKREFRELFDFYNEVNFREACQHHFEIRRQQRIPGSLRTLYWLERKV